MASEALTGPVQRQAAELEHLSGGSKIVRDIRTNTRSAGAQRNGERYGASGNLKGLALEADTALQAPSLLKLRCTTPSGAEMDCVSDNGHAWIESKLSLSSDDVSSHLSKLLASAKALHSDEPTLPPTPIGFRQHGYSTSSSEDVFYPDCDAYV
jgi:hypothetical protein